MSSSFVALIDIHDQARYREYLDGFDEVFERYDGEVIAVEDHPEILEGEWPAGRTVLIRFTSEQALRHWYESEDYQRLARHRHAAATANIAVISGRD